jgi:TrmH family RNA methyltransferase
MITSSQNSKVQEVRSLLGRNRERRDSGLFVIEGVRLAEEAAASGWPVKQALYSANLSARGRRIIDQLTQAGLAAEELSESVMQSLADTQTTQGILLVMTMRNAQIPKPLDFVVIADAIRDPGNLGTLLRTAAAAGSQAVLLTPGTADPFAPKVLRAGMGAHFYLPILSMDWPEIAALLKDQVQPLRIFTADSGSGISLWESDLRSPCTLVIGSEADGPSTDAQHLADVHLHIPMLGHSESLNAAAAAAILLFEVVRQRAAHQNSKEK